ncbi:uncharacterized protein HMPREF1541_04363 [Cyphellophora europaea CBS 101466]|uniref:Uncharacterized protein n=1 Tax=Cyphellophora europaea (strain CBS 101466) TaxID=1220924 RepID=W2RWE3_CYPE1|nr:uncharacterized protein HMPREF1541_04363 [Cyphellophora europaea CBS 101466]ETN40088.1 hypothetical protein HMPREF1541_04363 [Cyphellophora europaea CBS 101466]
MSTLIAYLPPLFTAMPVLTTLLGFTGFGGGLYTFTSPAARPILFGIIPPTSMLPSKEDQAQSPTPSQASLIAYIRVHGIRNFSNGLGLAGLSIYSLLGAGSPAEAAIVRKCLGVM